MTRSVSVMLRELFPSRRNWDSGAIAMVLSLPDARVGDNSCDMRRIWERSKEVERRDAKYIYGRSMRQEQAAENRKLVIGVGQYRRVLRLTKAWHRLGQRGM